MLVNYECRLSPHTYRFIHRPKLKFSALLWKFISKSAAQNALVCSFIINSYASPINFSYFLIFFESNTSFTYAPFLVCVLFRYCPITYAGFNLLRSMHVPHAKRVTIIRTMRRLPFETITHKWLRLSLCLNCTQLWETGS